MVNRVVSLIRNSYKYTIPQPYNFHNSSGIVCEQLGSECRIHSTNLQITQVPKIMQPHSISNELLGRGSRLRLGKKVTPAPRLG